MAAYPRVRCAQGRATTAEVNAGKVIVEANAERTLTVVDVWMRAIGGAAATATSVDIAEAKAGPTVVAAFAVAALTENAVARAGAANTTVTNVGTALTRGVGLQITKAGSNLATATHIDYCVLYTVTG